MVVKFCNPKGCWLTFDYCNDMNRTLIPTILLLVTTIAASGQTKTKEVVIPVANLGTVNVVTESIDPETCYITNDGNIYVSISGGVAPYTFTWRNSANVVVGTNEDLENVVADSYTLTVTDNTGCSKDEFFVVDYDCPYTCLGNIETTVTDASACAVADGEFTADLTQPGSYNYTLYKFDAYNNFYTLVESGSAVGVNFSRTFSGLFHGIYELEIVVDAACYYSTSVTIGNSDFYFYSYNVTDNTSCVNPNGEINLELIDPSLPNNYEIKWKNISTGTAENTRNETNTTIVLANLRSGYYGIELTDLDNPACKLQERIFVNNSTPALNITATGITPQTVCVPPNGAINITVTGGTEPYLYQWSGPSGFFTSKDLSGIAGGIYFISVTDPVSGCFGFTNFSVPTSTTLPNVNVSSTDVTQCGFNNGSVQLTPSGNGPFSIVWYDVTDNEIGTTASLTNLAAGAYGYQVTDALGCVRYQSPLDGQAVIIEDISLPSIDVAYSVIDNTDCNGVPGNGAIDLTVTTTSPTITYQWNGPKGFTSTLEDISALPSGEYFLTITIECPNNTPPEIEEEVLTLANNQTTVTLDLLSIVSDLDGNLVIDSLRIVRQPVSGAVATISKTVTTASLIVDYSGITFLGMDSLRLRACDALQACTEQELFIQVDVASGIIVYNAVSPLSLPGNQFLRIDGLPSSGTHRVTIYNRWGDLVYSSSAYDNLTQRFEGRDTNGRDLPSGTYFYKIEISGGSTLTGFLSLKR
jgi:gliding motility-associated-like protein